ncbi:hypothetical protein TTHERM_00194170 (macronuclear) [Tetrahymena thermophila SB210]|uniref:Uncharacterized protein n=1 Tax=Tetrahymena thermophila (strain SB210) TaxID=312017 RepID=Q23KB8_TETTS|nr:hypothetical protein TTHERM_00194170 [Tetrahymena thermophila SB210]EAR96925.2 hypothetical protein TTHERM_00194170 [Tetrahymena thermophila SB210]|eukprot:XP_001017170.2 hypothetical protein TTHERM_00194170 [Tetrahymena thermophila SB210]
MKINPNSFLNQLFSYNAHHDRDLDVHFIEDDDIIMFYKQKSNKLGAFFDQDKILNFTDDQSGLITKESFEKGIYNEVESIHNELQEIQEKREQAQRIIEEKKTWWQLRTQLMPQQQKHNFEDENYIMPEARFFVKVVCVEKNNPNTNNSTLSNKNELLRIQIDIDDASYSTEERVFDQGICQFQNNIFTLPITTGYERIYLKVVEHEYSEVKAAMQLKLNDFKDQKIHKRIYHLKPQKKFKELQYDIHTRIFYQYNSYTFNEEKLALRQETYQNIIKKLEKREIRLRERLRGLENSSNYLLLEYLDIICFENQEEGQCNQDIVIKVSKDFDSETASIYNEQTQAEIFFQNEEEETREFQRLKLYSDAPTPEREQGNFSFDNMSEEGGVATHLNQQMLNHILDSRRGSQYTGDGGTNTSSPFKLNLSQNNGNEIGQFISPRFNEASTNRQSLKNPLLMDDNKPAASKTLLELIALSQETKNLNNNIETKKNKFQQEINIKNSIYQQLSKMNNQELLQFRIFAKGLYQLNRLNKIQQQEQENLNNKNQYIKQNNTKKR